MAGSEAAAPAAASAIVPARQQPQQQQALVERPGRDRVALPGRPPRAKKAEAIDPMDPVSLASSPAQLATVCFGTCPDVGRQGPAPDQLTELRPHVVILAFSYLSLHDLRMACAAAVGVLRCS